MLSRLVAGNVAVQICGILRQLKSDHLGINTQNLCGFSDLFAVQILAVQISFLSSALPSKYACVRDAWRPAGTPRNFLSKQESDQVVGRPRACSSKSTVQVVDFPRATVGERGSSVTSSRRADLAGAAPASI
jgi:hypothetical protein